MTDNVGITTGSDDKVATDQVTWSGDPAQVQLIRLVETEGAEGAKTVKPLSPLTSIELGIMFLRRIVQLLKPLGVVTGGNSNRLSVDINNVTGGNLGTITTVTGVTTVTTVTTVSTISNITAGTITTVGSLTNLAGIGGVSAFDIMKAQSRAAFNTGIRNRIS